MSGISKSSRIACQDQNIIWHQRRPFSQAVNKWENIPETCNMNNIRFSGITLNFLPNKNHDISAGLSVNPYTKYKPLTYFFRIFSEAPYQYKSLLLFRVFSNLHIERKPFPSFSTYWLSIATYTLPCLSEMTYVIQFALRGFNKYPCTFFFSLSLYDGI
jgi:hypothetical protein